MATYQQISQSEMEDFLFSKGFQPVALPGTQELVYGKRVDCNGLALTLRVYSSIFAGSGRAAGEDAIRVVLFLKLDDKIVKLGGSKRVHRVQGWRDNLQSRLSDWQQFLPARTCSCGKPMVVRHVKQGPRKGEPFYGCTAFPECRNTERCQEAA